MQQNIIYVGLDVDDTQYHGSALDKKTLACAPLGLTVNGTRVVAWFPAYAGMTSYGILPTDLSENPKMPVLQVF